MTPLLSFLPLARHFKKLFSFSLSFVIVMSLLSPVMANSQNLSQQDIETFLLEHNLLQACFKKDKSNALQILTAKEGACLIANTVMGNNVTPNTAWRISRKNQVFPSGIQINDSLNEMEWLEILFKSFGVNTPLFYADQYEKELALFNKTEHKKVVAAAFESGIIALPTTQKQRVEIRRSLLLGKVNRATALARLYQVISIHDSAITSHQEPAGLTIEPIQLDGTNSFLSVPIAPRSESKAVLNQVLDLIEDKSYFRDRFDYQTAVKHIVEDLDDPFSEYLTPEEYKDFIDSLNNHLIGIGAYLEVVEGAIRIISPLEGSPAEAAGVLAGDIIIGVDGENVEGQKLADVVQKIRGERDTIVVLTVKRDGRVLDLNIVRKDINVPITTIEEQDGFTIIKLSQFGVGSYQAFKKALEEAEEQGSKGIIIDLRNNPGGLLDAAVQILDLFLEKGTILVQVDDRNSLSTQLLAEGPVLHNNNIPVAVLINRGSASASEIVAGTLQDYEVATIIGERSFGKGSVQQLFDFFGDQSALKLTTSTWKTGKGQAIDAAGRNLENQSVENTEKNILAEESQRTGGIVPDINAIDDKSTPEDEVLEAALEALGKTPASATSSTINQDSRRRYNR